MNPHSARRKQPQAPLRTRLRQLASEAILEAAEDVFTREGLQHAKMESIAARAGVAVGTLYNHFEDRDGLLATLVDARRQKMLEAIDAQLAAAKDAPFRAQLTAYLDGVFEHFEAHGKLFSLAIQAELPITVPGRRPLLRELTARSQAIVERGLKEKALRPGKPELYAAMLTGMARGVLLQYFEAPETFVRGAATQTIVDVFLNGAGAR